MEAVQVKLSLKGGEFVVSKMLWKYLGAECIGVNYPERLAVFAPSDDFGVAGINQLV